MNETLYKIVIGILIICIPIIVIAIAVTIFKYANSLKRKI